jgi:hypothetical protein
MNMPISSASTQGKRAVAALFEDAGPVLVEVRFPGCGTSPDWFLCEEEAQLREIVARLGPGAEVRLNSVWNLKNTKEPICLRKDSDAHDGNEPAD